MNAPICSRPRAAALPYVAALLALSVPSLAFALAPFQEDLSTCTLPHGDLVVPLPGAYEATYGYMLKLSDGTLHSFPTNNGKPLSPEETLKQLRQKHLADIEYTSDGKGTLWSISGRISDLGTVYLSEAAAMKLGKPYEVPGDSTHPTGLSNGVEEGRTYLIQATDGNYALVRIIEKTSVGLHIQYVYQPDGSLHFNVPSSTLVPATAITPLTAPPLSPPAPAMHVGTATTQPGQLAIPNLPKPGEAMPVPGSRSPLPSSVEGMTLRMPDNPSAGTAPTALASAAPGMNTPALTVSPAVPASSFAPASGSVSSMSDGAASMTVAALLAQRAALIRARMAVVEKPAATLPEITVKSEAIAELAELHATEAVDLLVRQITFLDAAKQTDGLDPATLHPAYAALTHLGLPAVNAALKAIHTLDLHAPSDGKITDTPDYHAHLLGLLVRTVEGDDMATYLFRREAAKSLDAEHRTLFNSLAGVGQ